MAESQLPRCYQDRTTKRETLVDLRLQRVGTSEEAQPNHRRVYMQGLRECHASHRALDGCRHFSGTIRLQPGTICRFVFTPQERASAYDLLPPPTPLDCVLCIGSRPVSRTKRMFRRATAIYVDRTARRHADDAQHPSGLLCREGGDLGRNDHSRGRK